jgi:hypothetical protein
LLVAAELGEHLTVLEETSGLVRFDLDSLRQVKLGSDRIRSR